MSNLLPKYIRVLKALENGKEVKLFGATLVISETNRVAFKVTYQHGDSEPQVKCLVADISLNSFIAECEKLTEEEMIGLISIPANLY